MSSDEIVLSVKNVSKCFEMYDKPVHRLWQTLCAGRKKFYKEFWALKDINFEVRKGECVGIIGRNGAGKSTLLQIITGTLRPTTGSVELKGRVAALLELGSGFNPEFTGRENVYMNAAILGLTKEETDAKYQEILDFADIGDFINQPVKTYSSGMMVRLAFAVQASIDPDILIIDEALAVGDALFQKRCFSLINQMVAKGVTFVFVTHDMETMRSMTTKALFLENGLQVMYDSSAKVLLEYRRRLHAIEEKYLQHTLNDLRKKIVSTSENLSDCHTVEKQSAAIKSDDKIKNQRDVLPNDIGHKTEKSLLSFGQEEASVKKVEIFNKNGLPCSVFHPKEKIKIRIHVKTYVDITHLNVSMRIRSKEGWKIYSWGTLNQDLYARKMGLPVALFWNNKYKKGDCFFIDFESICNLGGNFYEVQACVSHEGNLNYTEQRILHWVDEANFFRVAVEHEKYFFGGMVDMKMKANWND